MLLKCKSEVKCGPLHECEMPVRGLLCILQDSGCMSAGDVRRSSCGVVVVVVGVVVGCV